MPDEEKSLRSYPACLERPDRAGRVRTRTPKTESDYRRRYRWLCKRIKATSVEPVAQWLASVASTLRADSYRQYRAAVHQALRDLWDAGEITAEEVERIAEVMIVVRGQGGQSPYAPKSGPARTSAKRAKGLSKRKTEDLSRIAAARGNSTGRNLADHMEFGPRLGLRNSELCKAKLIGNILHVPCGKYSVHNGRGVDECRRLELDDFAADDLERLEQFLKRLRHETDQAGGRADLVMRRQGRLLREIRGLVGARRATLRTSRHQFTANLRVAGYTNEEIAAALGHASAGTSEQHYGKKNHGWRGSRRSIKISPELTVRVRAGAKKEWKIKNGLPLTRSESAAARFSMPSNR